ncbi:MAG: YidB family protein [Methylococcaceae bacterium]|nr:YidB family protein [Methylococcaceae bacterium]
MDLMKIGTQLILSKLGGNASGGESGIASALSSLLGGSSDSSDSSDNNDNNSGLDLGSLVSSMTQGGGGLASIVSSWLGDGDNEAVSGSQIKDILGGDKVAEFASKLGVDEDEAADSLAEAVPQMVDKGSSGGSLLDAVGGVSGAIDLAKKFLS